MWVERLYRDLCGHVLALTDLPAGYPAGFMDREIRTGEGWTDRLAGALASCQVFVPLFSPRFFASAHCGKEWYAFEQRTLHHSAVNDRPVEAIVPALWVPVEADHLPAAAEPLQFHHQAFGDHYASEGLYGLIKLKMFEEQYERAVYQLAKRIVSVAKAEAVRPGRPVDYRSTPSAFGATRRSRHLKVTVVADSRDRRPAGRSAEYYGESALDWNPYYPDSTRSLSAVAGEFGHDCDYRTELASFDDDPGAVDDDKAAAVGPELMVLDRWALDDPGRRESLARFDVSTKRWIALMVPWNRSDPDSAGADRRLALQLEETLPNRTAQGPIACRTAARGIDQVRDFGTLMPEVVEWASAQYARHGPAYPPAGPRQQRPRLTGPVPDAPRGGRPEISPGSPRSGSRESFPGPRTSHDTVSAENSHDAEDV